MAATRARVGRGTLLGYDLTSPYSTYVNCAEMVRLTAPEMDFGQVDATHLASDDNAMEFLPRGFFDSGEIAMTANYYTDDIETLLAIAVAQNVVGWQITIPDKKNGSGTDTLITFMGYVMKFNPFGEASPDANEPLRHAMTIKITGDITFTKATSGV